MEPANVLLISLEYFAFKKPGFSLSVMTLTLLPNSKIKVGKNTTPEPRTCCLLTAKNVLASPIRSAKER